MKIALIGATGFVGTEILKEALSRSYQVTAIARNIDKVTAKDDRLEVKAADINDVGELVSVLTGHDAVLSAFNSGFTNPNMYEDFIKGSVNIEAATKQAGVKRFMVVGGAGSLEIAPGVQLVDTPEFPAEYKVGASAARDYLNILKKDTELDWTFVSPAINLHPGDRTGKFRLGTDQPVFDADHKNKISVADLAVAMIDELENNRFIKRRFTLGY